MFSERKNTSENKMKMNVFKTYTNPNCQDFGPNLKGTYILNTINRNLNLRKSTAKLVTTCGENEKVNAT